jgi:hypothetical protein
MFGCGEINSAGGGGGISDACCGGGWLAQPANNIKLAPKSIISIKIGFFIDFKSPSITMPQWRFQSNLQLQNE